MGTRSGDASSARSLSMYVLREAGKASRASSREVLVRGEVSSLSGAFMGVVLRHSGCSEGRPARFISTVGTKPTGLTALLTPVLAGSSSRVWIHHLSMFRLSTRHAPRSGVDCYSSICRMSIRIRVSDVIRGGRLGLRDGFLVARVKPGVGLRANADPGLHPGYQNTPPKVAC